MELVLVAVAVVLITTLLFLGRNGKSPAINWPVIGMAPSLVLNSRRIHDHAAWLLNQSGATLFCRGPWFTNMDFLLTSDPLNVDYVLNKKCANFIKATPETKEILEPLGDGIFNSDSELWRYQRRVIHSSIKCEQFLLAAQKVFEAKVSKGLFAVLENFLKRGSEMDLQDMLQRFTFDSICLLVLGFDPKCVSVELPQVPYEKAFDEMEEAFLYRNCVPKGIWKLQRWLQVGKEKKLRKAWNTFDHFLRESITRKREQLHTRNQREEVSEDFDLLTCFLSEQDQFIRDNTFNLLIAGRDTVGVALAWLFWLILTHPLVEEKILEELKVTLQAKKTDKQTTHSQLFRFQEIDKLPYLHGTICETLRLYPSVPYEKRLSVEEDILPSGHKVKRNMKIVYSPYAMGRNEEIWGKDCLEFKPERWFSEEGEIKLVPSYKFTAFGAGPRACLGKAVSFMEMKIVAAAVIWNYRLQVVENHPVYPSASVILHMKHGFKVRIFER